MNDVYEEVEMKIRIETDENISEDEIIIRCKRIDDNIREIQKSIFEMSFRKSSIIFFKENKEYFIPLDKIMFFETDVEVVYAHTADDAYKVKYRLYELVEMLPADFIRISKSTILNIRHVYSVDKNITSSSLIKFYKSHKQVFASRMYFKVLKQNLDERRNYEN